MKAVAVAVLAALAVQPVVFFCWAVLPYLLGTQPLEQYEWIQLLRMIEFVLVFAAAHLAVIGLPVFFLLRHFGLLTWSNILLAGFLCGSVVMAVLGLPLGSGSGSSYSATWHGEVRDMIVAGVPTLYGWLSYMEGVFLYGLQGIAGATAFYWTWKRYAT